MAVQIRNDINELLLEEEIGDDLQEKLVSTQLVEEQQEIKYHFGEAVLRETFFDGYHIFTGDASVYENLHVNATEAIPAVSLLFMVRGHFNTNVGHERQRLFGSLEHNLYYNPGGVENAHILKQENLAAVGMNFSKERFLQLAENNGRILDMLGNNVAGNRPIILNKKSNHPITARMLMILDEIRNCQFLGGHKKLYLQSKVIELLALQCEQQEQAESLQKERFALSASDKEKIFFARDYLLNQMQSPPSLTELSRAAGLNEFKLKNGFKQVFDNTVFGYLNDHKMEYARQLLQSAVQSVTQIAEQLGFSSVQHFSTAFRKKFGVSPVKLRNA
ncbi:AraC family transcriptional regulator [Chitinophaga sp. LS1]|uniref:helix-turn-helix transcriptional regulator n=1 Tax=Chitinophaga sp. LS1 TaxID=3051176 RepID=UPI002AAC353E|nr:AraC family transcriptional regulator [Chitinophaga sp. LS1]WPV66408.1 AraC family transcriptional regulator [Chitinophaga sp. LS1]